ncbi:cysteine desulfurase [Patescibacteria group bacterium]|nr:cysteine desulfurase [Patescibacteria group bacterium]
MIYLDYAATTPLAPQVFESMRPYLTEHFGNPSSVHRFGQVARKAIDESRIFFVEALGAASPRNIIFTGSGTESCNLAIFGTAFANQKRGKHIIISAFEHAAILEPAEYLRDNFGFELTLIKPSPEGIINPEEVAAALRPDTTLVSIMYVNNEVGTVQPIKKIAKLVRQRGAIFHTDACQAPGYLDINCAHLGVDLMTLNASKVYGPKGIGLLYIREGIQLTPQIMGGGQEFRMRGGTESPAQIVGFASAMRLFLEHSKEEAERLRALRDNLQSKLLTLPGAALNGHPDLRLPNFLNLKIDGITGENLVQRLDIEGVAASAGAACSSGKLKASHVLLAMGKSLKEASHSIRFTLGRPTTEEEIEKTVEIMRSLYTSP